ncbi:MAG: 2-phosphosulfolactate phosphatase, partial [Candidatus Omnitrophota bacterium]
MLLDVMFNRTELEKCEINHHIVFVADVLRATTVMIAALTNGAKAILPQKNGASARGLYNELLEQGIPALLCGEKDGFKIAGYDLGNSPSEYTPEMVKGKTIVHLTTNGTKTLAAAASALSVFIVSFGNIGATAKRILELYDVSPEVLLIGSGREERYCLEDTVCLGGVITYLLETSDKDFDLTDSAVTAVDLFHLYRNRLLDMARLSAHGKYLESVGLGADLPECVKVDTSTLTPEMR